MEEKEKSTTELLHILDDIHPEEMASFIRQYGNKNPGAAIFSDYISEHHQSVSSIVQSCNGLVSKSYIYDILNGTKKNPSRDILLILCIAMHMNRKSTRRVLEVYGQRDLYVKDTRDIILATYINNKNFDLDAINEELYRYGLPTLHAD